MLTLVDGLATDVIPTTDRGLAYGDGLFETLALSDGSPRQFDRHLARMADGAQRLGIPMPESAIWQADLTLALQSLAVPARAVLKLILTRGSGGRGYNPPLSPIPRRILQVLPWPEASLHDAQPRLGMVCETRLGLNPQLAGIKHLNRLEQVLGAQEVAANGAWDGLMLDTRGYLIESTRANVFLVFRGQLHTPALTTSGVAGVMRSVVCEHAARWGFPVTVGDVPCEALQAASEIFLTNSVRGVESMMRLRYAGTERGLETSVADHLRAHLAAAGLVP